MDAFIRKFALRALGFAAFIALAACSSHGIAPTPSGPKVIPMTPSSVSPGKIQAPPMAKPAIVPMDTSVKPNDAIASPFWQPIPGTGSFAAAGTDGSLWVLSDQPAGPDKFIYHYVNGVWTQAAGTAMRLAVGPDNTLYAINSGGGAYQYNSGTNTFTPLGGGCSDITVASDGSVYVLSNGNAPGSDQAIWHYINGGWTQAAGSGVRIAANWDPQSYTLNSGGGTIAAGGLYIVNSLGAIYYENTSQSFALLPGQASSVAPTKSGGFYVLGATATSGAYPIFYFDLDAQTYGSQLGSAVNISTDTIKLYAVGTAGGLYYTNRNSQDTLTLRVVNNSGITPAYVTIIGKNGTDKTDASFYHVTASGQAVKFATGDFTTIISDGKQGTTTSYNIPLSPGLTMQLPYMESPRIYISLGAPLITVANLSDLSWAGPDDWGTATDPNFNILNDSIEFNYQINAKSHVSQLFANLTQVDMLGIPMQQTVTGSIHGTQTTGIQPNSRAAIMNALLADPNFSALVINKTATGTSVSPLRAISVKHAIYNTDHGLPNVPHWGNMSYFDNYISSVWTYYIGRTLTLYTSAFGTYTGTVNSANQFVFSQPNKPDVVFPVPSTEDALTGTGQMVSGPCGGFSDAPPAQLFSACKELVSMLSAGINRSSLLLDQSVSRDPSHHPCNLAPFYTTTPTNVYSQIMHKYSVPTVQAPSGAAYGFDYDDVCDQSSTLADDSPTAWTITVEPF